MLSIYCSNFTVSFQFVLMVPLVTSVQAIVLVRCMRIRCVRPIMENVSVNQAGQVPLVLTVSDTLNLFTLVEQELLTLQEHLSSPTVFNGFVLLDL